MPLFNRKLRSKLLRYNDQQRRPCLSGMEASGGAHCWAREIAMLKHEVRLMQPNSRPRSGLLLLATLRHVSFGPRRLSRRGLPQPTRSAALGR
ncbi:hypothetical protein CO656_24605 [Sinorhizobium sp. FG01]|nr:hypothetical protein CO656_24605 [Sinorhizobium sp. FG01]